MQKKILLAGCGYVGKRLAQRLKETCQFSVSVLTRSVENTQQCIKAGLDTVTCDLDMDTNAIKLPESNIVVYFIPPPPSGSDDPRINSFLKQLALNHVLPEKFILISTTGVYGDCKGGWVDESTPLNPQQDRAKRRANAESQVISFCKSHHIKWSILRVPGIYGPGKLPLERIRRGTPIVCEADSPWSNRIHVDDLVSICMAVIEKDNIQGIFNCTDGNPTTMYDYFTKIVALAGLPRLPELRLDDAREKLSPGMLSYMEESRRISNTKILTELDVKLRYPDLESGLSQALRDE